MDYRGRNERNFRRLSYSKIVDEVIMKKISNGVKIIIPMAGMGYRFLHAGYSVPKPLIKVEGKPMIEHVVNMFPGETDFVFICNSKHLAETPMRSILNSIAPQGKIVEVVPHGLGPVYSVLQAAHLIGDEEPVMITYCDFSVYWNYEKFKQKMQKNGCAACATAFRGFHPPHVTGDFCYAYMQENDGRMKEIREKIPFTSDRSQEFAGTGAFYFAKGKYVKDYFKKLMDRKMTFKGEYYISLVCNLLVEDGLDVCIHGVDKFLAWGTPEELEDYLYWSNYFTKEVGWRPQRKFGGQILVPMAGEAMRFLKDGYQIPKFLIKVDGAPMVVSAVKTFPKGDKYIFVSQKKYISESELKSLLDSSLGINSFVLGIDKLTEGGVCTSLLAESYLNPEEPLFIGACDYGLVWNEEKYSKLLEDESIDCIVWTFRRYPQAARHPEMYGWVKEENGWVKEIAVKKPVSDNPKQDPGIISAFWFRKAKYFLQAAKANLESQNRVGGEFHMEGCINNLLAQGRKAVVFDVYRFICWGTPNELRTWKYWNDYFSKTGLKKI